MVDDDDEVIIAKQLKNSWDDDDDLSAIPDSWDADPVKTEVKASSNHIRIPLSDRIKVKEEKKRLEKEDKLRREEESRLDEPISELRREQLAEEAEIGILHDIFVNIETLRAVTTAANAHMTEKQKLIKGKPKKKLKSKLMVERENNYDFVENDVVDDFDDFM